MITTLNKIKACSPCEDGWKMLLKGLNKTKPDDKPLKLLKILEISGIDDTLWCLRAVEGYDKELRLYAHANALRVRHLVPLDELKEFDKVLEVVKRYAFGKASIEEFTSARDSAMAYAMASAWDSTRVSAWVSALDSTRVSAWVSACASSWEDVEIHFKEFLEGLDLKE